MDSQKKLKYGSVEIDTGETLGVGSYGKVCKAKYGPLPCAAKLLHETMFQYDDPGIHNFTRRFEQECQFLSTIKHPNIIQYLGTICSPESGRPVLLMDLMDESLTNFLERSAGPLPYYTQVNICHDVALALAYLHLNAIIHRDLSSNNVLLIGGGSRAKVTDFGMSKFVDMNPRMTALTQCPGTSVYMPPEALITPPNYSTKLDCFSHGVLTIQVITRNFPNPGDASTYVKDPKYPTGRVLVQFPESDRRKKDIDLIESDHPLLPIALQCIKDLDEERPTADEVCEQLSLLKKGARYTQRKERSNDQTSLQSEVEKKEQEIRLKELQKELEAKEQAIQKLKNEKSAQQEDIHQINLEKEKGSLYKKREDYNNDTDYGKYIKSILKPGMKVRALYNYESVVKGDIGIYKRSNFFPSVAQIEWARMKGRTHRIQWYMIEILPSSTVDEDEQDLKENQKEQDKKSKKVPEIERDTISLEKLIGSGRFSETWEGIWNGTKPVAIKSCKPEIITIQDFLAKAQIMKTLQHENLIQLYAICIKGERVYALTELMKNDNLLNYLQSSDSHCFTVPQLRNMAIQIASGMAYLEEQHYIHMDLAARNIYVGEENVVKIDHFGATHVTANNDYIYNAKEGTKYPIRWTAPEGFLSKLSIKSDVWSYGVVLYELITHGGTPYPGMNIFEVQTKLKKGYRMPRPPGCPDSLYQIMMDCWKQDPEERPTFKFLMTHLERVDFKEELRELDDKLMKVPEIERDTISLEKLVRSGRFGEIWEGIWNGTKPVAIKSCKPEIIAIQDFLAKAQVMKTLQHEKLIQIHAVCTKGKPVYALTELKNGNLSDFLKSDGHCLIVPQLIDMAIQIASGMAYLEEQYYIHMDLIARNIYVGEENVIKIDHFGATHVTANNDFIYNAKKGTIYPLRWTAPEGFLFSKFSIKSDVWSYGIVLYELITHGQLPYPGMNNDEIEAKLVKGYRMPPPAGCPDSLYQIMMDCWKQDPKERPTFKSLMTHLERVDFKEEELKELKELDNKLKMPSTGLTAKTLYDYQAEDGDELSFDVDEIITNIEQVDPGWWIGTLDGSCGLFPSNYVELERDTISLEKLIGSGHFGEIWEGIWDGMKHVVIKSYEPEIIAIQDFLAKAQIMKTLQHEKLIQLYAVCTKGEPVYALTEPMKNGNLLDYLQKSNGRCLTVPQLIDMAIQIASGMAYLEEQHYIHMDLAAQNIYVGEENVVKIVHFGATHVTANDDYIYNAKEGTKYPMKWTAPEGFLFSKFSIKSDVWSYGIVLYELITHGGRPYPDMTNDQAFAKVKEGYRMPPPPGCPDSLYQIMMDCWKQDPKERPTFKFLMTHLERVDFKEELKELDNKLKVTVGAQNSKSSGFEVLAMYDYESDFNEDLSFCEGQKMIVLDTDEDWWRAQDNSGKEGYIPSNYVKRVGQ